VPGVITVVLLIVTRFVLSMPFSLPNTCKQEAAEPAQYHVSASLTPHPSGVYESLRRHQSPSKRPSAKWINGAVHAVLSNETLVTRNVAHLARRCRGT
jgi:hypothetical protein